MLVSGWFYQSDVCALERTGAGCLVPFGAGMLVRYRVRCCQGGVCRPAAGAAAVPLEGVAAGCRCRAAVSDVRFRVAA